MNYNSFPIQKVPYRQKTREWKEACVKFIVSNAESGQNSGDRVSRTEMKAWYDLYNSVYDENRLKYVTNPFKQTDGFPATAQNVNIIKPQIDLLLGEESKKPFNFQVVRTSETATSEIQEQMHGMIMDYLMSAMYAGMSEEEAALHQQRLENGEIQPPENIIDYYTKSYKDVAESIADKTLKYLKQYLNLPKVLIDGLQDALSSSEEIYYIGNKGSMPSVERVNPMMFTYEYSPDLEFIHDASWCCRKMVLSHQDVYDRYYDKLSDSDLNKILAMIQSGENSIRSATDTRTRVSVTVEGDGSASPGLVNLWHTCWQSYKRIGFVTLVNEDGEMEEFQVDESYHVTGDEISVEWEWATETWEGYYIDDDLFFGIQPLDYQYVDANSLNATRLPYTGTVYYNNNSKPKSFIGFLEPLQYTYIMLWYRLELTLARDKGKVLTMDITQIPKSYDIDVSKWLHMLSALGINLINPYDEGWNIPGRTGGKASSFNQISSEDLSMSRTVGEYVGLLDKVEQMAGSLTGITPQRQGAINSRELVGNVERGIVQSANITEHLFYKHNNVKREVLSMLLNTAKNLWVINPPASLHYILDDGERIFLQISDDFLNSDFDIFVSDSTEEMMKLRQLESLYQPAMQNGASLLDVAEIMTIGNMTKIKAKLADIEAERNQRAEQAAEQERETQLQIEEMRRQMAEAQLASDEADRELQRYKIDTEAQTKIQVATIGAYRFQDELDQDGDGIPDPIQLGQLAIAQQDAEAKKNKAEVDADLKKKEIDSKKEIENKKVQLEREKMSAAKEIQKMKDAAALKREELKARTALKNPVAGEK